MKNTGVRLLITIIIILSISLIFSCNTQHYTPSNTKKAQEDRRNAKARTYQYGPH